MSDSPLIVLKFGGSVLLDEQRLRIAVHEIYRWRREGWRVLAVVSALAGHTQELIDRCTCLNDSISDLARAGMISSGELESASLLGVHLDRAGIPARVLTPAGVQLIAHGDPLDAELDSVERAQFDRAFDHTGVVVFPGFVAASASGETLTLGRGGSDLSAVFLAHRLGAQRCRLIKDVDGLYESDPASSESTPRRYACATFDDALSTDGSIIQHKALRYAKGFDVPFELGRLNGTHPTRIQNHETRFDEPRDEPRRLSITLCGLGTVGRGVLDLALQLPEMFTITGALCKSPEKHRDLVPVVGTITDDASGIAVRDTDVLVELIGGSEPARTITRDALTKGTHVISANKALVAQHATELHTLASASGCTYRYAASVGGVVPVLEALGTNPVRSVRGVLNGTGNFVLGALERGIPIEDAVRDAQRLGFAELDPSRDLDGRDAIDKLIVIARTLGIRISDHQIEREPIVAWAGTGLNDRAPGTICKQVGTLDAKGARVRIETLEHTDPLADLVNEWNAAVIEFEDGTTRVLRGKGAGRWPTSESVFADLLELSREYSESRTHAEIGHG